MHLLHLAPLSPWKGKTSPVSDSCDPSNVTQDSQTPAVQDLQTAITQLQKRVSLLDKGWGVGTHGKPRQLGLQNITNILDHFGTLVSSRTPKSLRPFRRAWIRLDNGTCLEIASLYGRQGSSLQKQMISDDIRLETNFAKLVQLIALRTAV